MERSLGLVQDLLRGSAEDDRASLSLLDTREPDQLVLADDDLLDEVCVSQLGELRVVEGGGDLGAEDEGQALDALEVGVLDGHHARRSEHLLGEVVDQLTRDEHVAVVLQNLVNLLLRVNQKTECTKNKTTQKRRDEKKMAR